MKLEPDNTVYYLAGPMSYVPQFNIPRFDATARNLRAEGFRVVSPAELDDYNVRDACLASSYGEPADGAVDGRTWGDFLARDVKLVADEVDGIIFLPDWEKSRGARLEAFVGLLTGKRFAITSYGYIVWEVSRTYVQQQLVEFMP